MSSEKPVSFGFLLKQHMRERGFRSDEQLARRAMMQQVHTQPRINVQRRTINNWRNGKTMPRSIDDPQLCLVMDALKLDEPEKLAIEAALLNPSVPETKIDTQPATGLPLPAAHTEKAADPAQSMAASTRKPFRIPREAYFVLAALLLVQTAYLAATGWNEKEPLFLEEIPPTQLTLSSDGFVLPDTDKAVVSERNLETLTGWELYVARNEIFARKGRPFVKETSVCLQNHFNQWQPSSDNPTGWYTKRSGQPALTDLEYRNAEIIRNYECRVRGGQYTCNGQLNPC